MISKEVLGKYIIPEGPFIETGTWEGNTVACAIELGASPIYTVEPWKKGFKI